MAAGRGRGGARPGAGREPGKAGAAVMGRTGCTGKAEREDEALRKS